MGNTPACLITLAVPFTGAILVGMSFVSGASPSFSAAVRIPPLVEIGVWDNGALGMSKG